MEITPRRDALLAIPSENDADPTAFRKSAPRTDEHFRWSRGHREQLFKDQVHVEAAGTLSVSYTQTVAGRQTRVLLGPNIDGYSPIGDP